MNIFVRKIHAEKGHIIVVIAPVAVIQHEQYRLITYHDMESPSILLPLCEGNPLVNWWILLATKDVNAQLLAVKK